MRDSSELNSDLNITTSTALKELQSRIKTLSNAELITLTNILLTQEISRIKETKGK